MTTPPSADPALIDLFARRPRGVLMTIKRDGRPQSSVVAHAFDPGARTLRVSLTDSRAKTRNLRRDPRASYMVIAEDMWSYAVADGRAELTPVTTDPHDATADALVELYRAIVGEHPDWAEYRAAMVADRRLVLTVFLEHVYGFAAER